MINDPQLIWDGPRVEACRPHCPAPAPPATPPTAGACCTPYRMVGFLPAGESTINHGLGHIPTEVQVRHDITGAEIILRVINETLNTVTFRLPTPQANARITIL